MQVDEIEMEDWKQNSPSEMALLTAVSISVLPKMTIKTNKLNCLCFFCKFWCNFPHGFLLCSNHI